MFPSLGGFANRVEVVVCFGCGVVFCFEVVGLEGLVSLGEFGLGDIDFGVDGLGVDGLDGFWG